MPHAFVNFTEKIMDMEKNTNFSKEKHRVKTGVYAKIAAPVIIRNSHGRAIELAIFMLRDQLNNMGLTLLL